MPAGAIRDRLLPDYSSLVENRTPALRRCSRHRYNGSVLNQLKLNAKSKIQEETPCQILRHLYEDPELSQRELCAWGGASGQLGRG